MWYGTCGHKDWAMSLMVSFRSSATGTRGRGRCRGLLTKLWNWVHLVADRARSNCVIRRQFASVPANGCWCDAEHD